MTRGDECECDGGTDGRVGSARAPVCLSVSVNDRDRARDSSAAAASVRAFVHSGMEGFGRSDGAPLGQYTPTRNPGGRVRDDDARGWGWHLSLCMHARR